MKSFIALVVAWILIVSYASAVPVTGAAVDVNSNGFNTTAAGVVGTEAWVYWGDGPGLENWASPPATVSGGVANIQVIGAPIYGGEQIYYQACDATGCGNEMFVSISAVTPMPTTTHGKLLTNITRSRFAPQTITASLVSGYTSVTPATVLFGIAFMFLMIGIWYRTKSVRLISILGILISPFIMYTSSGLQLGIPSVGIGVAQGLLAAGMAGVLFSFIRK